MDCNALVNRLIHESPGSQPRDIARMCLLICNTVSRVDDLADEEYFDQVWQDVHLRLTAAVDQHAAMTRELETLAHSDPQKFSPDQIWVLVRAIRVQSQILDLYLGTTSVES